MKYVQESLVDTETHSPVHFPTETVGMVTITIGDSYRVHADKQNYILSDIFKTIKKIGMKLSNTILIGFRLCPYATVSFNVQNLYPFLSTTSISKEKKLAVATGCFTGAATERMTL